MSRTFEPRPDYEALVAYRADRPTVEVDLSDSTNQWGVAPSALQALRTWSPRDISEYPPVESSRLDSAFASYAGVPPECVIGGCGSDNLLDAAMRALARPGDVIAHPSPTFMMVPVSARANGLVSAPIATLPDGDIDAPGLLATRARIIYLCTPNNPTGIAHSRGAVERILAEAPGVVILDEAYAEFADFNYTKSAPACANVFATRTMSKSFGLAGLRVGFGIGAPKVVGEVLKARGPYKVNSLAERAATAALLNDHHWMNEIVSAVRAVRSRFASALNGMGLHPLPSQSNFLCVPVTDARAVMDRLYAHSIAVRAFPRLPGVGDALRIGLAPWPVMERVLDALRAAV